MNGSATIAYASPFTTAARPVSKVEIALALAAIVQPALSFALLVAADKNWLPDHFLCCRYYGLAIAWFAAVPAAGFVAALLACNRLVRRRSTSRGLILVVPAGVVFALLVPVGLVLLVALKA